MDNIPLPICELCESEIQDEEKRFWQEGKPRHTLVTDCIISLRKRVIDLESNMTVLDEQGLFAE